MSEVLCFRRPPASGPIVSNFLGGIKRGRNVTGASYGARTNDGIVTDLETPSCCRGTHVLHPSPRANTRRYTFCDDDDDEDKGNPTARP